MATRLPTLLFVLVSASVVGASVLPMGRRCQLLCDEAGGSHAEADGEGVCVCQLPPEVADLDYQNLEAVKKKASDMGLLFIHVPREGRYERCLDRILKMKAKKAENEDDIMRKKWLRYEAKKRRHPHKIMKGKDNDIEEKKYSFKGRRRGKGYETEENYEAEGKEYASDEKGYERSEKGRDKRQREERKEEHKDPERSRRDEPSPATKHPIVMPRVVPRL